MSHRPETSTAARLRPRSRTSTSIRAIMSGVRGQRATTSNDTQRRRTRATDNSIHLPAHYVLASTPPTCHHPRPTNNRRQRRRKGKQDHRGIRDCLLVAPRSRFSHHREQRTRTARRRNKPVKQSKHVDSMQVVSIGQTAKRSAAQCNPWAQKATKFHQAISDPSPGERGKDGRDGVGGGAVGRGISRKSPVAHVFLRVQVVKIDHVHAVPVRRLARRDLVQ